MVVFDVSLDVLHWWLWLVVVYALDVSFLVLCLRW
jgi:hypothetical protein